MDEPGPSAAGFDQQQLVTMVGDRHSAASRLRVDRPETAEVAFDPGHFGSVGPFDDQGFFTGLVGDGYEGLAVVAPGGQAPSMGGGGSVAADGPFPEGHGEGASPRDDRQRMAPRVEIERLQVLARRDEPAVALRPGGGNRHPEGLCLVGLRVEQPQVASAVVDDPASVCGGMAGVEAFVGGVPSQPASGRGDRIQVADSLVIRDEVDPPPDPHRVGHVPVQLDQTAEALVGPPSDPDAPDPSASVSLPTGGVECVSADHHPPSVRGEGHGERGADLEWDGLGPVEGDRPQVGPAGERLAVVGGDDDRAAVG